MLQNAKTSNYLPFCKGNPYLAERTAVNSTAFETAAVTGQTAVRPS